MSKASAAAAAAVTPEVPAVRVVADLPSVAEQYTFMGMSDRSVFEENLGGEPINPFDLARLKVPGGDSVAWAVPNIDGKKEAHETVEGILVSWRDVRSYWQNDYTGESVPPDCSAPDGKRGTGNPGGFCEVCALAQFGSDTSPKSNGGQACKAGRLLFLMVPGNILPMVITVPPTSIKPIRQYFLGLVSRGIPFHGCVTSLGLVKDKNKKGIPYNMIAPTMAAKLSKEDAAKVKAYADTIQDSLAKVSLDESDVTA